MKSRGPLCEPIRVLTDASSEQIACDMRTHGGDEAGAVGIDVLALEQLLGCRQVRLQEAFRKRDRMHPLEREAQLGNSGKVLFPPPTHHSYGHGAPSVRRSATRRTVTVRARHQLQPSGQLHLSELRIPLQTYAVGAGRDREHGRDPSHAERPRQCVRLLSPDEGHEPLMVAEARAGVDVLARLIEDAFDRDQDQSLMANLRDLRQEDWTDLPSGAGRSIAEVLEHVGWAKWMYEDHAFGEASLSGNQPPLIPSDGASSRLPGELLEWLSRGHQRWLNSVRALPQDSELDRERLTNWVSASRPATSSAS